MAVTEFEDGLPETSQSNAVALPSAQNMTTSNPHYTGNVVQIPDAIGSGTRPYIIVDEAQREEITEFLRYATHETAIEEYIQQDIGKNLQRELLRSTLYTVSPLTLLISTAIVLTSGDDTDDEYYSAKKWIKNGAASLAISTAGFLTLGPIGLTLPLLHPVMSMLTKFVTYPFRDRIGRFLGQRKFESIMKNVGNIAVLDDSATPVPLLSSKNNHIVESFAKNDPTNLAKWMVLPGNSIDEILKNLPSLANHHLTTAEDMTLVFEHIERTQGSLESLRRLDITAHLPYNDKAMSYEVAARIASYPNMPRDLALEILSQPFASSHYYPSTDKLFDIVKTYRDIARLTDDEIRTVLKDWRFIQLNPTHLEKILLSTPSVKTSSLGAYIKPAEGTSVAVTEDAAKAHHLPPHISPEQVARVRENLNNFDAQAEIARVLESGAISAAHEFGEAQFSEISRILSTINGNSQFSLNMAKKVIAELSPLSDRIEQSQRDIEALRDPSLMGTLRRLFRRLNMNKFANTLSVEFNEIDRDVASARRTSIDLMKQYESLRTLGNVLDEPLQKINDAIDAGLANGQASPELETVLRSTQAHAMTLMALSGQARQMVDLLLVSESNFSTFTKGLGIANVASGLAQTVNDMTEKDQMVSKMSRPVDDTIADHMRVIEDHLTSLKAGIAAHQEELARNRVLASQFQLKVLALPTPDVVLNPLDDITAANDETTIAVPRVV